MFKVMCVSPPVDTPNTRPCYMLHTFSLQQIFDLEYLPKIFNLEYLPNDLFNFLVLQDYVYDSFNSSPISLKPYQISSLTDFEHILQILDRGFILHPGSYMRDYWNVSPPSFIAQLFQNETR